MEWNHYHFEELSAPLLYDVLKLRVDVFVVEQNCVYPEIDGLDKQCVHMICTEDDRLIAYARLVPKGIKYDIPSIGRVIVHPDARRTGLGKELIKQCIVFIENEWKEKEIYLQGQEHLKRFYGSLGFEPTSGVYDEDGIPHIDMKYAGSIKD